MGMVRYYLADQSYDVQCPTCRQFVPATRAMFDGETPLPAHSRWAPSWAQRSYAHWPTWLQRRWTLRVALRAEALVRLLARRIEPTCSDETPRRYREWLPDGCGQTGPVT